MHVPLFVASSLHSLINIYAGEYPERPPQCSSLLNLANPTASLAVAIFVQLLINKFRPAVFRRTLMQQLHLRMFFRVLHRGGARVFGGRDLNFLIGGHRDASAH